MLDTRYADRDRPTIWLCLWPTTGLEYWYSSFEPMGVPLRTWHEPIEDEL